MLRSCGIAFSMYSRIPMPKVRWEEKAMRYAFCFFPLVGALTGGLSVMLGAWLFPLRDAGVLPAVFPAVLLTLLPLVVTGGIHMDGFMDTSDARHSWGEREKKLEILKDPHTGAFAVICACMYLLFMTAIWSVAKVEMLPAWACACVISRALSGWAVTMKKGAKKDGLAAAFRNPAKEGAVWVSTGIYLLTCGAILFLSGGFRYLLVTAAAAGTVFFYYLRMAKKEFGGITGDLAGWFLEVCELTVLTAATAAAWLI